MYKRLFRTRQSTLALIAAPILAMAGLSIAAAAPSASQHPVLSQTAQSEKFSVRPNPVNMLDCNGWSNKYKSVIAGHADMCTDPHGKLGYVHKYSPWASGRFVDNGHYIGHDEPSVKFLSNAAGTAFQMTYFMRLPHDPPKPPTNNGRVTHYAELTGAAWFGLPLCDPASYTQKPCTPHSDKNSGLITNPNAAGSAFMELQFYAPGFIPFQDNTSCSTTKWCTAMTIDSIASQFNFVNLNPACPEPVNFAYLTHTGTPGGPPSPQLGNGNTFTPNGNTLEMNSGDVIKVSISDPLTGSKAGFTTTVTDLTTHKTGFMIASAKNGFMNTNFRNCNGSPFTFHAEYNSAKQQNQVPWAALEGGVLMEQEMGHSEACSSLTHQDPTTAAGLMDKRTFDTCVGGAEGSKAKGEGSCNLTTFVCQNPTTEGPKGPIACPSNKITSGALCEFADGTCLPQGPRTIVLNGKTITARMPINWCQANRFQNGDRDYDGITYQTNAWPNGSNSTPTSFRYAGPFDAAGHPYPQIQFETDAPGSEFQCNLRTGTHCVVPPLAAHFYPYWTLTNKAGQGIGNLFPANACIWNFGNTIAGVTTNGFGKDKQYGKADAARYLGTAISKVQANPQITGGCPVLKQPKV